MVRFLSPVREVTRQPQFSFLMRSHSATFSGLQSDCDRAPQVCVSSLWMVSSSALSAPLASPKVRCAYENACIFFSVGPLLETDREEGLNWKIGFPLRKHVVPAPSFSDARGFIYLSG